MLFGLQDRERWERTFRDAGPAGSTGSLREADCPCSAEGVIQSQSQSSHAYGQSCSTCRNPCIQIASAASYLVCTQTGVVRKRPRKEASSATCRVFPAKVIHEAVVDSIAGLLSWSLALHSAPGYSSSWNVRAALCSLATGRSFACLCQLSVRQASEKPLLFVCEPRKL